MDFAVSRSLLVGPTPNGRFAEEGRILVEHFPGFALLQVGEDAFGVASGRLSTFASRSYGLHIVLLDGYPNVLPVILPDGWTPKENPHIYTAGNLCVMKSSQWRPFMSVAFLVAKTALWLNKYEIFLAKAIWPGADQHPYSYGPMYKIKKRFYGL
jgi:hypothetical protein